MKKNNQSSEVKKSYTKKEEDVIEAEKKLLNSTEKETSDKRSFGLAISGGGIRSASFGLGVMQVLAKHNILKKIDYMSTVSGGGYLGAALTWWLKQGLPNGKKAGTKPENFPFGTEYSDKSNSILDYLRLHGNYLTPEKRVGYAALIGNISRAVTVSLTVYLAWFSLLLLLILFLINYLIPLTHYLVSFIFYQISLIYYQIPILFVPIFENPSEHLSHIKKLVKWLGISGDTNISIIKGVILALEISLLAYLSVSFFYSVATLFYQYFEKYAPKKLKSHQWAQRRYEQRTFFSRWFGVIIYIALFLFILVTLPLLNSYLISIGPQLFFISISVVTGMIIGFWSFGSQNNRNNISFGEKIRPSIGTAIILYTLVFGGYLIANAIYTEFHSSDSSLIDGWVLTFFVIITVAFSIIVNVNYLGIHRMYRDRLMELFMPDVNTVTDKEWNLAESANSTLIERMRRKDAPRPYHIINSNVVLVDSNVSKFRGRGGSNFIITPLYCGSDATGWRRSDEYMKKNDPGMTLATAIAISGAAANPNTGVGGDGLTRNPFLSVLMSLLNLRLGYWAPNTNPEFSRGFLPPNFIFPGLISGVLRGRLHEKQGTIDLTDGGHFENLGIYELLRRKLDVIIACDGAADINHEFGDLGVLIERAGVDFGINIEFADEEFELSHMATISDQSTIKNTFPYAKRGFSIGNITYADGKKGTFVYIKSTIVSGLGPELNSYAIANPSFPHESTTDQFFDERQFEAYRKLGYILSSQLVQTDLERLNNNQSPWILDEDLEINR